MRIIFDRLTGLRFFAAHFVLSGSPAQTKHTRTHPVRAASYAIALNHGSALLEIIITLAVPLSDVSVALTKTAWVARILNPKILSSVVAWRLGLLHILDDLPHEGVEGCVRSEQNGGHFGDYEDVSRFDLAEPVEHLQNQSILMRS